MNIIPTFTSAYSFRSILTVEPAKDLKREYELFLKANEGVSLSFDDFVNNAPKSIFQICSDAGVDKILLVEDNMVSFWEANKNSKNIRFVYGVRMTFCHDINDHSPESEQTEYKLIVFASNSAGYKALLNLYSFYQTTGYHKNGGRLDIKSLKQFWNDNLTLAVPFYNSFIANNLLTFSNCIVDLDGFNPTFFVEDHGLPIDFSIRSKVKEFCTNTGFNMVETFSIFYDKTSDFVKWQTMKCIHNRSTLDAPQLDGCGSNLFSFEEFLLRNGRGI